MLKRIVNILLFGSLVLVLLIMFFFVTNYNLVSENNLNKYIKDADILNIKASYILNVSDDITVIEKLENMALELNIPEEIIVDILDSEELKFLLVEYFERSLNSYYDDVTISQNTIDKMIDSAHISSMDHLSVVISDEELEYLIIEYCNNIQQLMPEKLEVIGNSTILKVWNYTFDYSFVNYILIILVLIVIVTLINKDFKISIKYIGLGMLISGVIYVLLGSLDNVINTYLTNELDGIKVILSPLITQLTTIWFQTGFLLSFSGVFIYLIFVFIKRIEAK